MTQEVFGPTKVTCEWSQSVIGGGPVTFDVTECDGPVEEGAAVNDKGQAVAGPRVPGGRKP